MSCCASGAMVSSAAMLAPNATFDFFPAQAGSRVVQEVGLAARQFFLLPVVDWDGLGRGGQVIPEILDEVEFFRGTQIENRSGGRIHWTNPFYVSRSQQFGLIAPMLTLSW